jgi:hypothetical protein
MILVAQNRKVSPEGKRSDELFGISRHPERQALAKADAIGILRRNPVALEIDDEALSFVAACHQADEMIVAGLGDRFAKAPRFLKAQTVTIRHFLDVRYVVEVGTHDRPALGGRNETIAGAPTSTERDHEIPLDAISNSIGSGW